MLTGLKYQLEADFTLVRTYKQPFPVSKCCEMQSNMFFFFTIL
jgi:hypothetical protein